MDNYTLTILGCRGSFPMEGPSFVEFGGATSCYVLRSGEYAVVIDCGTGFCAAASVLKGCTKVDVLLTHLHYDHVLGFLYPVGIPEEAQTRLFVYTPEGQEAEDPLSFIRPPYWPITARLGTVYAARCGQPLHLHDDVTAHISPSNHPGVSAVLRFDTGSGSFCVICDWEHGEQRVPCHMTDGCSFVLYDGTYTDEEYEERVGWGHSTWREGVELAKERGISRLLISHHAPDHTDAMLREMEQEAQKAFPNTRFVRIEDQYDMRGERL